MLLCSQSTLLFIRMEESRHALDDNFHQQQVPFVLLSREVKSYLFIYFSAWGFLPLLWHMTITSWCTEMGHMTDSTRHTLEHTHIDKQACQIRVVLKVMASLMGTDLLPLLSKIVLNLNVLSMTCREPAATSRVRSYAVRVHSCRCLSFFCLIRPQLQTAWAWLHHWGVAQWKV